jgi:hypothetical protein
MSSHVSDPTETAESARFERAIVRFDAAHAGDPTTKPSMAASSRRNSFSPGE